MTKDLNKTIKIGFYGFSKYLDCNNNIIKNILDKHFNVEVCENPDYYFVCSAYMNNDWTYYKNGIMNSYCKFPQIRILLEGENLVPDFNLVDYSISSFDIKFLDRNFYLPCGIEAFYATGFKNFLSLKTGKREYSKKDLSQKEFFANFIVMHESENNIRGDFFKKLSEYKRVESLGKLYHNNDLKVSWRDGSKEEFQRKCKFTLCFESTKQEGFITEKIIDAFKADTIPIYYGSSNITEIFNKKAFINCNDYENFEQVINEIIAIDNDDERYISIMQEPIFNDNQFPVKLMNGLENFLVNIFTQPLENAYRRSRVYSPIYYEKFLLEAENYKHKIVDRKLRHMRVRNFLKNPIKCLLRKIRVKRI